MRWFKLYAVAMLSDWMVVFAHSQILSYIAPRPLGSRSIFVGATELFEWSFFSKLCYWFFYCSWTFCSYQKQSVSACWSDVVLVCRRRHPLIYVLLFRENWSRHPRCWTIISIDNIEWRPELLHISWRPLHFYVHRVGIDKWTTDQVWSMSGIQLNNRVCSALSCLSPFNSPTEWIMCSDCWFSISKPYFWECGCVMFNNFRCSN